MKRSPSSYNYDVMNGSEIELRSVYSLFPRYDGVFEADLDAYFNQVSIMIIKMHFSWEPTVHLKKKVYCILSYYQYTWNTYFFSVVIITMALIYVFPSHIGSKMQLTHCERRK